MSLNNQYGKNKIIVDKKSAGELHGNDHMYYVCKMF